MKQILSILAVLLAVTLLSRSSFAQDPTKVDSKHYKVEFENDKIRVLRISYAPGEKSVMHAHPDAFAIFLNDEKGKFTLPDGKTIETEQKAGSTMWTPAGKHLPENTGDKAFELILVELKSKKK